MRSADQVSSAEDPTNDQDFHLDRPTVYLDHWVWVRLARAALNRTEDPVDLDTLAAVQSASAAGVAFPLSATHYQELSATGSERQRGELAHTMAAISYCRTLRFREDLLRHQMLMAMYLRFGRPTFRPTVPEVLGIGVDWAFSGKQPRLALTDPDDHAVPVTPQLAAFYRQLQQGGEMRMLEGAREADLDDLRRYGYDPEPHHALLRSRLDWEKIFVDLLADGRITREELRVRVQAREMIHEHLDMFSSLLAEYHLDLSRALGADPDVPGAGREQIVAFADAIPSLRIATDLKVELFRDTTKPWNINALHDIDALSTALPYCHVVVPDKQMANLLSRSRAGERNNTIVVAKLADLPAALSPLAVRARALGGDPTGWDRIWPGAGWDPIEI